MKIMYHITMLLLAFLYEHFPKLIEDGRVYIALSPLYRVRKNKSDKYLYFKNDKEYDKFVIKEIGKKYKLDPISLSKFITNGKKYTSLFDSIRHRYNIDIDVLNIIENHMSVNNDIRTKDIVSDLKDIDLAVTKEGKDLKVEGLYRDTWHKLIINDEFVKHIEELSAVFNDLDVVTIEDAKDGHIVKEDEYIYNALNFLNNSITFVRNRFKGLGEADANELFETTLDPKKRDLVQVNINDFESTDEINKILFGNNADLRKMFIDKYL